MKKILLYAVLLLFGISSSIFAQNISNSEKRRMNMAILEMIENLETVSEFSTSSDVDRFISMFRDPDIKIFNDLIGTDDDEMLSVTEYASLFSKMNDIKVEFSDIEKSLPYISTGSLCVKVSFDKSLSYMDGRNVLYSSDAAYGAPYRLHVVFSYDDFDGTCLIESVEGEGGLGNELGNGHVVYREQKAIGHLRFRKPDVPSRSGYYAEDECGNITYNSAGQALLPASAAVEDLYYMQNIPGEWDPDMFITTHLTRDGFLKLGAYKSWFRAKAYSATAPAGAFAVVGEFDEKFSIANETGVELRFMYGLGKALNLGVYGALGVSYSHLNLKFEDFGYVYLLGTTARKYEFDVLGQKFNAIDVVLSGGLDLEYCIASRWTLEAQVGGKAYYNLWAGAGDLYCDYVVTHGSEEPIHKVGHFKAGSISGSKAFTPDVWPCPLSVTGSLGVSYNLTKSTLLSCGLEYEHGLNCYYQSELVPYKEGVVPISYSLVQKADVAKKSMTNSFHLYRRSLWLDLGVTFKF